MYYIYFLLYSHKRYIYNKLIIGYKCNAEYCKPKWNSNVIHNLILIQFNCKTYPCRKICIS